MFSGQTHNIFRSKSRRSRSCGSFQSVLRLLWPQVFYTHAQRSWGGGGGGGIVRTSVCRRHGFRSISQVSLGISISNFICMLMVAIGRSLLIFSDVIFKMAAWRPYWIFWFLDSDFTLALNINFKLQRHNTYIYIWVRACWFSATLFSKWPPGGHIGFFGFQTLTLVWLWISTPNLSSTILMHMCRSLLIFSNVNFKMTARQPY